MAPVSHHDRGRRLQRNQWMCRAERVKLCRGAILHRRYPGAAFPSKAVRQSWLRSVNSRCRGYFLNTLDKSHVIRDLFLFRKASDPTPKHNNARENAETILKEKNVEVLIDDERIVFDEAWSCS